jgi:hypothetical protein
VSAALTLLGSITASTTNSGNKTVTATPAVGDLIFLLCGATGNTSATAPTDNNSDGLGSYTQVGSTFLKASSADALTVWVRNSLIGSATSTTFTHNPGTTSGGFVAAVKATGMSVAGLKAIRQSAGQQNATAATTPAPVLPATPYRENPVFGAVFNATNPATMTPRSSPSYTERGDTGYSTPTSGFEVMTIDSGETSATITWGGTSASAFASFAAELNTTAFFEPHVSTTPTSAQMDAVASVSESLTVNDSTTGSLPASVGAPASLPSIGLVLQAVVNSYSANIAEAIAAQDLISALLAAAASVSEPHVSTDPQSVAMVVAAAISEPHVSTDLQAINPAAVVSETIVAQDLQSSAMAAASSVSEPHVSTAPTDGSTGSAFLGSVSETIVAQDPQSVALAATAAVSEPHVSTSPASAQAAAAGTVSEAAAVADTLNGSASTPASVDAPAPLPSIGLVLGAPTAFSKAVVEALVAQDPTSATTSTSAFTGVVVEALVAQDQQSAALAAAAAVSEAAALTDAAAAVIPASVGAPAPLPSIGLLLAAAGPLSASVVEAIVAQDPTAAAGAAAATVSEPHVSTDPQSVAMAAAGAVVESAVVQDPVAGALAGAFAGAVSETAAVQDLLDAALASTEVAPQIPDEILPWVFYADPGYSALYFGGEPIGTPPAVLGESLVDVSESTTVADLLSAAVTFAVSVTEALVSQDPTAVVGAATAVVVESYASTDPQSATMAAGATVSEAATVSDVQQSALPGVLLGFQTETIVAQDQSATAMAAAATSGESALLSDVLSAAVASPVALAEGLGAADAAFATLATACTVSEGLGLGDLCDATVGAGGVFFASIIETLDVIASAQASAAAVAALMEALVSADVSQAQFVGELEEDPRFTVVGSASSYEVSAPTGTFNIVKEA